MYINKSHSDSKLKVYTALQHVQKDLLKISNLPRCEKQNIVKEKCCKSLFLKKQNKAVFIFRCLIESDTRVDMVLNGRIGSITPSREGMMPV